MSGFNVETYQLSKKKNSATNEANYDSLSNRVTTLENNLMSINNTFMYDFSHEDYIDLYKSTVIITSTGITPKQYLDTTFIDFNKNDDYVDYDNSSDIKWMEKQISLDDSSTLTGTLMSFPIKVNNAVGMKFDCNYKNKSILSAAPSNALRNENLWFVSETDKYGRLWILSSEHFSYGATNKVHMIIYNTDMTVYKSYELANSTIFDPTNTNANCPIFGPCDMKFTDENVCILVVRIENGTKNGQNNISDNYISPIDKIMLLNESGQVKQVGYYQGYYLYNNGHYGQVGNIAGGQKPVIIKKDEFILILSASYYYFYYEGYNYHYGASGPNRNIMAFKINGSLTDFNNLELVKEEYTTPPAINYFYNGGTMACVAGFNSNGFIKNNYFNVFINAHRDACSYYPQVALSSIYSLQVGVDYEDKVFNCESSTTTYNYIPLKDVTANPAVLNNTPAFNSMHYSTTNDRLYLFSNFITSKVANLKAYTVDWTSRKAGNLIVSNIINKTVNLQTCSHSVDVAAALIPDVNKNNWNKFMEVVEFDNQLHLFYFAPTSDTITRLCLKYMAFDMDLKQTIEETILWQQTTDTIMIQKIDVRIFNDELLILYSLGNNVDYTTKNTNAKIYSIRIGKVTSDIRFYYLDDAKRIWTNINSGDEVTFGNTVSEVTIKAILESDTYDCSPIIKNMTLETWNNNNGASRQSEYYSNRIDEIENDGKGVLIADYEENDGVIEWFISYDGGGNYGPIKLNEEFVFTHLDTPDFRVKAIMSVTDNAKTLPIIHSYTLKTNYVVLQSDLEEIQINLIKTNFKIDTYTNAAKNGLLKMTVDTLSDSNFIDDNNSKYTYYNSYGYTGGNYLQTKPEVISQKIKSILLTVDEICEKDNDKILYYASADGGLTFKEIKANVKTQITNTNTEVDTIVMKAIFYGQAKLNAWGWAWD